MNTLQIPIHLEDPRAVPVPASTPNGPVIVWLDADDAEALGTRKLHIGSHGYAQTWRDGQAVPIHRVIMGCEHGDGRIVDHINGDRLDCRKANLRIVTARENAANRRCTAASGYRGVYPTSDGRWVARGKTKGRSYYLGRFTDPREAAAVADEWRAQNLPGYVPRDATTAAKAA